MEQNLAMGQSYSYAVPKIEGSCRQKGTLVLPRLYQNGRGRGLIISNVDAHWSCAFYKGLDYLQLKDGLDKTVLK